MTVIPGEILFSRLCREELSRQKERESIGLLKEKRLHAVLKRFVCEDVSCHEQKVPTRDGKPTRFVADVRTPAGDIFEIQTGSLYPLKKKLAFYMEETDAAITVVHPLAARKFVSWMEPETGEIVSRRKSPKQEGALSAVAELLPYISYLTSPRFTLLLPFLEVDEYRLKDGWGKEGKRGSHRYELMPMALLDLVALREKEDYRRLLPRPLPPAFTAKDFSRKTKLAGYDLYHALAVFEGLHLLEKCGKKGRAALYRTV